MNVTHKGTLYSARAEGHVVRIEPQSATPLYICSLCGAEAAKAEDLPHGPACPEGKATGEQAERLA